MKAAYANRQPQRMGGWHRPLALAWSRDASHAQGPEAFKILEAAQRVQRHLNETATVLVLHIDGDDALTYDHIAPKRAFTVKGRYKFTGRIKPRQFPLDE